MKLYLFTILAILVMSLGLQVACDTEAGLSDDDKTEWFSMGHSPGYSWGYYLTRDNPNQKFFWTRPDRVDDVQKLYPDINLRDYYIPKGYRTLDSFADTHFPDGTALNSKQKKQAMESYNWGFYSGFNDGAMDCLDGKPDLYTPWLIKIDTDSVDSYCTGIHSLASSLV